MTLSGGQRARVNLARAVYKEADIFLLDDPLSAVDTHVGKQLFDDCICRYLKSKCVVLVTHQLQYLKNANRIYLLQDGGVKAFETYREFKNSASEFTKLLEDSKEEEETKRKSVSIQESEKIDTKENVSPIQEKEYRVSGSIQLRVYKNYFKAGGGVLTTWVLLSIFVLSQAFGSLTDYFVSLW